VNVNLAFCTRGPFECWGAGQSCQIFLGAKNQHWEKCTKMASNIPDCYNTYQNSNKNTKCSEVHQSFPSQALPKYTKIGIFGLKNIPSGNPGAGEKKTRYMLARNKAQKYALQKGLVRVRLFRPLCFQEENESFKSDR
jgi:hypothetical protein